KRARNSEHIEPLIRGAARGNERTRGERSLDHEAAAREAADQTIASREVMGDRRCAQRKFRNQQAVTCDLGGEFGVTRRIDDVDAGAQYRNGRTAAGQPAAVSRGVDPQGKSRDDGQSGSAERGGEMLGVALSLRRCVAAAYDSERGLTKQRPA